MIGRRMQENIRKQVGLFRVKEKSMNEESFKTKTKLQRSRHRHELKTTMQKSIKK